MSQESQLNPLISTLAFGALGAALVFYGRRAQPGLLTSIATTTGYGLVTKAISSVVFAAIEPSQG